MRSLSRPKLMSVRGWLMFSSFQTLDGTTASPVSTCMSLASMTSKRRKGSPHDEQEFRLDVEVRQVYQPSGRTTRRNSAYERQHGPSPEPERPARCCPATRQRVSRPTVRFRATEAAEVNNWNRRHQRCNIISHDPPASGVAEQLAY